MLEPHESHGVTSGVTWSDVNDTSRPKKWYYSVLRNDNIHNVRQTIRKNTCSHHRIAKRWESKNILYEQKVKKQAGLLDYNRINEDRCHDFIYYHVATVLSSENADKK